MNQSIPDKQISRRQFLKYGAALSATLAGPVFFSGCAIDPVTGKKELMMVSRQQEIAIDKHQSAFQFSSDYGISQDDKINQYISEVGKRLLAHVHRPDMPYSFHCVNATYINAYAFPGGSIAATRGILLKLDNEANLASLLGHELGHVNARHTAEQMSRGQLSSLLVSSLSIAAATQGSGLGQIAQKLGMMGQGLFLSRYSRENEREADFLGNEYMVKAGYPSQGFVGLMEMLNTLHDKKPSSAQILFSTHPISSERLNSAIQRAKGMYRFSQDYSLNRERYMDSMASLRRKKKGIEQLQKGEKFLGRKDYGTAQRLFEKSLNELRNDYTAHVLLSKCLMLRKKPAQALSYANTAKKLYPKEAQGHYLAGLANQELKKYDQAFTDFDQCDRVLPGNPQMKFLKGYILEKKGVQKSAADKYIRYLKLINYQPNKYSKYAYNRLKEWGYAK